MIRRCALLARCAACRPARRRREEGGWRLLHAGTDINNVPSLQRGARNFMNYCSGCHSLKYLRYNRMAADLQIPERGARCQSDVHLRQGLRHDQHRRCRRMRESWFGKQPPDLSLIARAKGVGLRLFVPARASMPTRPVRGASTTCICRAPRCRTCCRSCRACRSRCSRAKPDGRRRRQHGAGGRRADDSRARLKPEEYDQFVRDIANFLDYAGEPIKAKRQSLGVFVIAVPAGVLRVRLFAEERILEGRPLTQRAASLRFVDGPRRSR